MRETGRNCDLEVRYIREREPNNTGRERNIYLKRGGGR